MNTTQLDSMKDRRLGSFVGTGIDAETAAQVEETRCRQSAAHLRDGHRRPQRPSGGMILAYQPLELARDRGDPAGSANAGTLGKIEVGDGPTGPCDSAQDGLKPGRIGDTHGSLGVG